MTSFKVLNLLELKIFLKPENGEVRMTVSGSELLITVPGIPELSF